MTKELLEMMRQEESNLQENEKVGRVTQVIHDQLQLMTDCGLEKATLTGKMAYEGFYPGIGDYVVYKTTEDKSLNFVLRILERRTALTRKVAGTKSDEQVIAANMDYVFIVMALNNDFNLRRLERYMIAAWSSGATPVLILTKRDLCDDLDEKLILIEDITIGVEVLAISVVEGINMDTLDKYLNKDTTIALVGSSGVGKSTLINYLADDYVMKTDGLRDDDKGHHTTTYRKLIVTPRGMFIDTPGMRELSLHDQSDGFSHEFSDIETLGKACKFADCQHVKEPGCAIQEALESGVLQQDRYKSYLSLKKELRHQKRKILAKEKQIEKKSNIKKKKPREKTWQIIG